MSFPHLGWRTHLKAHRVATIHPQTFNLFELLWQSEGLNPKPVELNLVLFILAKISCKTNSPTFSPTLSTLLSLFYLFGGAEKDQDLNYTHYNLLWQSEGLNPKPIELNLVLFILAKISCKNKCALFCALFCAL